MARESWQASALGNEILISLALGWGAGAWLDSKTAQTPLFTLLGAGAGLAAAVRGLLRTIRAYEREGGNDDDDHRDDAGSRDR